MSPYLFVSPIAVNWLNVSFLLMTGKKWAVKEMCFVRLLWMTTCILHRSTYWVCQEVWQSLPFFTFIWMIPHTHRRRSKLANYILTLFLCMSRHKQIAFPGSTVRRCILILANVAGLIANFGEMLYLLQCLICQRWHMKKQNKTNSAWLLLTLLEWELFKLVIMPHVIVAHWTRLPAHLCSSALRFIVTHAFVV